MLNTSNLTFKELNDFIEMLDTATWEEKADLCIAYNQKVEEEKLKRKILSMFPTSEFPDYKFDLHFIDPGKTMAVIIVISRNLTVKAPEDKNTQKEKTNYFSYYKDTGVGNAFSNYDNAILDCFNLKYKNGIEESIGRIASLIFGI